MKRAAKFLLCMAMMLSATRLLAGQEGKAHLLEAKRQYDRIRSYRCKASNVVMKYGLLKPTRYTNRVLYSFEKPDRIRMTWISPFLLKGQVAVFRNKELRVKMRFMPFAITMDPDGLLTQDPAGNRIYDTSIGRILDTLLQAITPDTNISVPMELQTPHMPNAIPIVMRNAQGRALVMLDRNLKLPVSVEFYDPGEKLVQACYFEDMALDVHFDPGEFELRPLKTI